MTEKRVTPTAELYINSAWTDISPYVAMGPSDSISITRGRQDEASQVQASACTLTLNNKDGRFTPRNPSGPYYGLIGRNTPLQVTAATTFTYAFAGVGTVGSYAVTPSASQFHIGGDLDVRAEFTLEPDAHTAHTLLASTLGTSHDYSLLIASGHMTLRWRNPGGTTFDVSSSTGAYTTGARSAIRATLDVDDGSGNRVLKFYTATSIAGPWVQLGSTVTTAGTTSIRTNAGSLYIGIDPETAASNLDEFTGNIYAAEVRNGIAGTVVAAPDFTAQGNAPFTDSAGLPWSLGLDASIAQIPIAYSTRFTGEVAAWPQSWNDTGDDVWCQVQAAGILRRLGQGQPPKQTGLHTYATTTTKATHAYPGDTANDVGVYNRNGPLTFNNCAANVYLGQGAMGDGLPVGMLIDTTNPVPGNYYNTSGYIRGFLGAGGGSTDVFNAAGFVFKADSLGTLSLYLQAYGTLYPGGYALNFDTNTGIISVLKGTYDPDTAYTTAALGGAVDAAVFTDGLLHSVLWTIVDAGATLTHTIYVDGSSIASFSDPLGSLQGMADFQLSYQVGANDTPVAVSYLTFWADRYGSTLPDPVLWAQAADGYIGETAGRRIQRLCSENSIPFTSVGNLDDTTPLGPQGTGDLVSTLQDAASADIGILYEPRDQIGLAYRTRTSIYNQAVDVTLDYSGGVLATAPGVVDDDQGVHNDVTVTRPGGGTAEDTLTVGALSTQAPPNGIGLYATSASVNVVSDGLLADQASWRLALSTVDETRWPSLAISMVNPAVTGNPSLLAALVACDLEDLITVTHLPSWLPPDDVNLLAQGYTETLQLDAWDLMFNCSPASPYSVAAYGATQGASGAARYDAEHSYLDTAINSTATSLAAVSAMATAIWTTDSAACPFDINISGERMTVTAVTGADMSFVGAGTAATGNNASVTPGLPAGVAVGDVVLIYASIRNSGTGTVTTPTNWTTLVNDMGNAKIVGRVYDGAWSMPAVAFAGGVANADTIAQSCAFRGVRLSALGFSGLNGSAQDIASPHGNVSTGFGDDVIVLYAAWKQDDFSGAVTSGVLGSSLIEIGESVSTAGDDAGQVWNYAVRGMDPLTADPTTLITLLANSWSITGGAAAISRATVQVLRRAPQTFTVTRSVNGVVKSHSAGDKISLWNTPRYAL